MDAETLYYLWAVLLVLANLGAWATNLFMLPGNWIVVGFTALFAYLQPNDQGRGIGWAVVGVLLLLAALGEVIEFVAGAAGAAKQGASRRAMALALLAAIAGSVLGAVLSLPIPVVGPIVGAVGGGALGAFLGAYLGELWKGRTSQESVSIGQAALVGRLLGTIGKLVVGAIMVVVSAVGAFF